MEGAEGSLVNCEVPSDDPPEIKSVNNNESIGSIRETFCHHSLNNPVALALVFRQLFRHDLLNCRQVCRSWNAVAMSTLQVSDYCVTLELRRFGCEKHALEKVSQLVMGCEGRWAFPFLLRLRYVREMNEQLKGEPNWRHVRPFLQSCEPLVQKIEVCDCAGLALALREGFGKKITLTTLCGRLEKADVYEYLCRDPPTATTLFVGVCQYHKSRPSCSNDSNYVPALHGILNASTRSLEQLYIDNSFEHQLKELPVFSKLKMLHIFFGPERTERLPRLFGQDPVPSFPALEMVCVQGYRLNQIRIYSKEFLRSYLWDTCTPSVQNAQFPYRGLQGTAGEYLQTIFPNFWRLRHMSRKKFCYLLDARNYSPELVFQLEREEREWQLAQRRHGQSVCFEGLTDLTLAPLRRIALHWRMWARNRRQ